MISVCQIRDYAEVSFGQVSTSFKTLQFSNNNLNKIFENVAHLYFKFRPIVKKLQDAEIGKDGMNLPSDGFAFKRLSTSPFSPYSPPRFSSLESVLSVPAEGAYNVEYFAEAPLERLIIDESLFTIDQDFLNYDVNLKAVPSKVSLFMYLESDKTERMDYVAQTDSLTGPLGSATFVDDSMLAVALVSTATGVVKAKYRTEFLCCEYLDPVRDVLFVELFIAQALVSLGMTKNIMALKELPYDMTADSLADFGKSQLEILTRELKETRSKWWLF